jgi:choline-sulfatase
MPENRPNIIFIFADQMRGDALGSLPGSPVITPNLDRLSAEGITFTQCMSNSPLCVPARTSLMTGQLVRETGIWSNRSGTDEHGPSHVRNIRDAGYNTAVIGKTHLWRHGPGGKPGVHVNEMDHNLEGWGFDYRFEVNDPIETSRMFCHYTDYLESKGWYEAHKNFILAWIAQSYLGADPKPWDQPPAPVPEGEDIDSFVGRKSVEWLEAYDRDKPFYLQVQFTGPHDPYDGPQSYRDRYDPSSIDPGITAMPDWRLFSGKGPRDRDRSMVGATTEQLRRWRINYYANITLIDEWIGRILATLERRGKLDDTWIIFNSDHGEMLGDHCRWSKANFYEQSILVPCILRPAKSRPMLSSAGWRSEALVEHVDLPVTMLDIAEAQPLDGTLGRTLLPYFDIEPNDPIASQGKEAVLSELFGLSTVCTKDYRLTVTVEDNKPVQLFDLRKDPKELKNFVSDPNYADTISSLVSEYLEPQQHRINREKLEDYRNYARETGRVN